MDHQDWYDLRQQTPEKLALARQVLEDVRAGRNVTDALRRHPLPDGGYLGKQMLVAAYRELTESGEWQEDASLLARIRLKPVRTLSGVTTVTVLDQALSLPGQMHLLPDAMCACPRAICRMSREPGGRWRTSSIPTARSRSRLAALQEIGHPTDKVELLILGGTWSAYRRDYQEWFILRCFDALNGVESAEPGGGAEAE